MNLEIVNAALLLPYRAAVGDTARQRLNAIQLNNTPVNSFEFYNSVSSVYSAKIEGENIDFDSFFKHKFLGIKYQPDYTKKADDLYLAYTFIQTARLTLDNLQQTHSILSANLLPKAQQGRVRANPMFVINSDDRIEYVAAAPAQVEGEFDKLFRDIDLLQNATLNDVEAFYFAAYIHLVFVKIHPFQDGNGRAARLLEKWFLTSKLGPEAIAVQLEKNYYRNLDSYYANLRALGTEYNTLDYAQALPFLLMTVSGLANQL